MPLGATVGEIYFAVNINNGIIAHRQLEPQGEKVGSGAKASILKPRSTHVSHLLETAMAPHVNSE